MRVEVSMKGSKVKECVMAKVNFIIKMEDFIKANGKIIKWMVMGNYIMKEAKSHMKAIGYRISLMGWGKSIMIILSN